MSEGSRPLTCDVPQMDLGNHEPKIFGLNYRQLVMFLIAGIIMWQILKHNWGRNINWYMPWVFIVFTPAVYFSSIKPFGLKPERFLLTWIRFSFLTKAERPYMSSLQNVEKISTGEAIKGVQDKIFTKKTDEVLKEDIEKEEIVTKKAKVKKVTKSADAVEVNNKMKPDNENVKAESAHKEAPKKKKPVTKKAQPKQEEMGSDDFFFN